MDSRTNSSTKSASPTVPDSIPQRPSILRSHLSVTFSTLRAVIPLRITTVKQERDERPKTAPPPYQGLDRRYIVSGQTPRGRAPIPRICIPSLSDCEPLFPNKEARYYSFRGIEHSRCTFCGMRSAYKPSSSDPCEDCRSKDLFSKMGLGFRPKRRSEGNSDTAAHSQEKHSKHSASSDEAPRIVAPEVAVKRAGNPPRRARIPVPRPGATNTILNPPSNHPASQSLTPESTFPNTRTIQGCKSAHESDKVRPTSPKLHRIHGLPNSKAYPYVHKSEVPQHCAAIRAGTPSPLADFTHDAHDKRNKSDRSTDFTETVYYRKIPRPAFVADVQKRRQGQLVCSNVVEELPLGQSEHGRTEPLHGELWHGISEQLDHGDVYRGRIPEQESPRSRFARLFGRRSNPTGSKLENDELTPKERRYGLEKDAKHNVEPRLRGGGGDESASYPRRGLLVKHLLLTCRRPDRDSSTDSSSDDDEKPVRRPDPMCIARTARRAHGNARLPRQISRISPNPSSQRTARTFTSNRGAAPTLLWQTASFAATSTTPHPLFSYLSPFPRLTPNPSPHHYHPTSSPAPPVPSLRGGAGSPSTLRDHERVPPTLLWLAGGSRKTMTTANWKARKPKSRMGSFFGLGLYGLRAGEAYAERLGKAEKSGSLRSSARGSSRSSSGSGADSRGSGMDRRSASKKSSSIADCEQDLSGAEAAAAGVQEGALSSPVVNEGVEDAAPVAEEAALENAAGDLPVEAAALDDAADARAGESAGESRGGGAIVQEGSAAAGR